MSERNRRVRVGGWLVLGLALLAASPAGAADRVTRPDPGLEPRVPVGRCLSAGGTLLAHERAGRAWETVGAKETVRSRDLLLALPGTQASLETQPGSVRVKLWGNLPEESTFPGLESSAVLHDSRAFDLDLTLVTGRVVLSNKREKGEAKVWLRLPEEGWQLALDPGSEVALELYGRRPRGVPFRKEPGAQEGPTQVLVLVVLKGQLDLKTPSYEHSLSAPPGPAYFHWDNVGGEAGPRRLDRLPPWADPKAPPPEDARDVAEVVRAYRERLKDRGPSAALLDLLARGERETDKGRGRLTREFAVLGLAALDDVVRVAEALADERYADVRDTAVMALRHWIGKGRGHDRELYERLMTRQLGYTKGQAEILVQLLHSPFAANQPETYEVLLAYLRHGKLAIRELALWHLTRLAPAGRDIRYDPAGPEAERKKAAAEWDKVLREREKKER